MIPCNATIVSADVTDDDVAKVDHPPFSYEGGVFHAHEVPHNLTVQRRGDRLVHVDLCECRCNRKEPHSGKRSSSTGAHWHKPSDEQPWFVEWYDDTPGAKPHTALLVTDSEREAAVAAAERYLVEQQFDIVSGVNRAAFSIDEKSKGAVIAALEAAAEVRREKEQA